MERQFVNLLQPRDSIDEIYRVADKQLRANRQGNDYILIQLNDRTGQISGLRWNASQAQYESFQRGDYLRIIGTAQLHNGNMQIIVQDFENIPHDVVNEADFSVNDPGEVERNWEELSSRLRALRNPHLLRLVNQYLSDPVLNDKLRRAPAGIKTHHAYEGGLLRHLVDLMRVATAVAPAYPQLDADMLIMGVFLHDLGKMDELSFDGELTYSDSGQLIGHLVQGVVDLQRRADSLATATEGPIPEELLNRLSHMIVSHHGYLEHGSPKVPMTLEAIVLHYLDDMDAKVNAATEVIRADRNSDSPWTSFQAILGRKLYKPSCLQ
ncbi:MAG: HD domain-containing protein [Pirellulaceae bacterium]|nr:HD domain-containing protein [Pirellulaceae bacterium]